MMLPALAFFFKIALAIQGLFFFHTNFRIVYSISGKNVGVILIVTAVIMCITLGSIDILTMFVLPIQKDGIFFHFLCVFQSFLESSVYRFFTSLVMFISRYFMVFGTQRLLSKTNLKYKK